MPTPPIPHTATNWPGRTLASFTAAPKPVVTAQPITAAISNGISGSIVMQPSSGITARSANEDWAAKV